VSFDMNVVGSNNNLPVSYNGSTCTLRCHEKAHPVSTDTFFPTRSGSRERGDSRGRTP
jgi:hypothetical protein